MLLCLFDFAASKKTSETVKLHLVSLIKKKWKRIKHATSSLSASRVVKGTSLAPRLKTLLEAILLRKVFDEWIC